MKERHSYIGKLNGISGIWCDQKPEGLELTKTVDFYTPDEGCIFVKDKEYFDSVVITDGVDINDYVEIEDPRTKENETKE